MPFTLAAPTQLEEEIKKSRFLTRAFPLQSSSDFDAIITDITRESATHHCWAWKCGSQYRFNDDGEPSGTAGRPILAAIEGRDCDYIAVIITRWFGGVKLGTGGLVRAYGGGAARCLQQAELIEIIAKKTMQFHATFQEWPLIESRLDMFKAVIDQQDFDMDGCAITLTLPLENYPEMTAWLGDISRGRLIFEEND